MITTFNGDQRLKDKLSTVAADLARHVPEGSREREQLEWASRSWCPAPYVCQKGAACDHRYYADEIGVPVWLAYAERAVFLNLSQNHARRWWARFFKVIPVGCEFEDGAMMAEFAIPVLYRLLDFAQDAGQYKAIKTIIDLYTVGCEDDDLWTAAALQANVQHGKSPYNNNRMNAHEARIHAGCMACHAASYFARAYSDPRCIAEAISWSGWPARYLTYSRHMEKVEDPRKKVPVDDRGMVQVGTAFAASGEWMRASDQGDSLGEAQRLYHYHWVSTRLIETLEKANPVFSYIRVGGFLKRMAENWGTGM